MQVKLTRNNFCCCLFFFFNVVDYHLVNKLQPNNIIEFNLQSINQGFLMVTDVAALDNAG